MTETELVRAIMAHAPRITIGTTVYYIVENDRKLAASEVLHYAKSVLNPPPPTQPSASPAQPGDEFSELISATVDGRKMRWKVPTVLTWAMDKASFKGNQARLDKALEICTQGTEDWNQAARDKEIFDKFHFEQVDECANPAFLFAFHPFDDPKLGDYFALAFFPNDPADRRVVHIGPRALDSYVGLDQVGIIRHELGHVIGFRHGFIHEEARAVMTEEEKSMYPETWFAEGKGAESLTEYDGQSVMQYPIAPDRGLGNLHFELTEIDKKGFAALYSAPYDPATIREFSV